MSSSFSRDSTPLFDSHSFKGISKDGLSWSITISTSGLQAFTGWPVCPKWGWAFQNQLRKPPAFQQTASKSLGEDACTTRGCSQELQEDCPVPVASSCCFVTVHHPPSPAFHSHPTVLLGPDLASTGPKGKTFWGGFLINPKGLSCSSLVSTRVQYNACPCSYAIVHRLKKK